MKLFPNCLYNLIEDEFLLIYFNMKLNTKQITVRTPNINRYFSDINKYDLLTPEEEVELFDKIKEGCNKSKQVLINSNLKFVISNAKQYQSFHTPIEDLMLPVKRPPASVTPKCNG